MAREPMRISPAGAESGDIDEILDRKGKAIQPAVTGRFPDASGARNEGAEFCLRFAGLCPRKGLVSGMRGRAEP